MVKINLLPAARQNRGALSDANSRTWMLLGIALVVALVLAPVNLDRRRANALAVNQGLENEIAQWRSRAASIDPLKAQYQSISAHLTWYYQVAGTGLDPATALRELEVTIPGDVWVTSLAFATDGTAAVSAMALDFDAVAQFMSQLKLSPVFAGVELQTSTLQTIGTNDAVSFQLKVTLKQV